MSSFCTALIYMNREEFI